MKNLGASFHHIDVNQCVRLQKESISVESEKLSRFDAELYPPLSETGVHGGP